MFRIALPNFKNKISFLYTVGKQFSEQFKHIYFTIHFKATDKADLNPIVLLRIVLVFDSLKYYLRQTCSYEILPVKLYYTTLNIFLSGIDYKTTTILLDGKRVKLQLW